MKEQRTREFSYKVLGLAREYGIYSYEEISQSLVCIFNPIKKDVKTVCEIKPVSDEVECKD